VLRDATQSMFTSAEYVSDQGVMPYTRRCIRISDARGAFDAQSVS